jgi:hypothetical protein
LIPGVGAVHPCIDRVVITSPFSVGRLKKRLPMMALKRASHAFDIVTPSENANPRTGSVIVASGVRTLDPWSLLKDHKHELGSYSIVSVEIAFDVFAASEHAAQEALNSLIGMLSKRNHQRGFLRCEHKPDHIPPDGLVSGPTYYLENRKSGVNLKCYVRHEKLAGGKFGRPIMRLEWTLKGKPALVRHLGGNQIGDLLQADPNGFLERNLRLERVDHLTLGKVFRGYPLTASRNSTRVGRARTVREQWADPDYWTKRAAYLVLRWLAYREQENGHFDYAREVCQNSPAQIRGYLRELRDGKRRNRGRPKMKPKITKRAITDHRINKCFTPIKLQRVRPRIIIATLPKSPGTTTQLSIT